MSKPRIGIFIIAYNAVNHLIKTINRIPPEVYEQVEEIFVIDDCSKDNTFEVLKSLFGNDSDVRIVKHETNKGVSAAILTGINAATTDIVASIDADCSYDPHELARMLPLMTKDVAMVTASTSGSSMSFR